MALLDKYDKDGFSDADYKRVRSNVSKRLLSTNKEFFQLFLKQWKELILREKIKMIKKKLKF